MKHLLPLSSSAPDWVSSFSRRLKPLGTALALLSLGGCLSLNQPDQPTPAPASSPIPTSDDHQTLSSAQQADPQATRFFFDPETRSCKNSEGDPGHNFGQLGECGELDSVDLRGRDLRGRNLRGILIKHSDLSDARLDGADLTAARWMGRSRADRASFEGARLDYALFHDLSLQEACFRGAVGQGTQFSMADLRRSDFTQTRLQDSWIAISALENAKIMGVDLTHGIYVDMASRTRMKGASIDGDTLLPFPLEQATRLGIRLEPGSRPEPDFLFQLTLDSRFTQEEEALVLGDLGRLSEVELDGSGIPGFAELFGGTDQDSVARFLADRIAFLRPNLGVTTDPTVYAVNVSIQRWSEAVYRRTATASALHQQLARTVTTGLVSPFTWDPLQPPAPAPEINGIPLELVTPRTGIVHLGPAYTAMRMTRIERVFSLVHEARHSDCSATEEERSAHSSVESALASRRAELDSWVARVQSVSGSDPLPENMKQELRAFLEETMPDLNQANRRYGDVRRAVENDPRCGYWHADCPADHPDELLRGMKEACETVPWGSYAASWLYSKAVARGCTSCTARERARAEIREADSLSRILNREELLSGRIGPPDPSSY